ncbi:MAG: peptidoglycan DD-metalloendopeptidase family protein [Flavobacteriales bacterium]|nr:peptidoglycan DD-metalloendopeptidase family protein [Flavobacteriales bacterium]
MKKWNKIVSILLFLALSLQPAFAQKNSEKLKQKQRELEEKIKNTKELIGAAKNKQRISIAELAIINSQINYREELISNISSQVRRLNQQIEENKSVIEALEEDLVRMKQQYSSMVFYAYKHRNTYHKLLFVFAARDFNTAFLRVKYLKQYGDSRKRQVEMIKNTQDELAEKNLALSDQRVQKESLVGQQEQEKENFLKDKEQQQQALSELQKEEKKLRAVLDDQEEKKRQIARQIKKALEEEIRKQQEEERKRKEAERKKAEGNNTSNNNTGKTNKTEPTTNKKTFDGATPDNDPESTKFENNKGSLPWPVEKGEVTEYFGTNPHPTLKGCVTNNNGIDIGTPRNAKVRSVFEGTVSSILVISGAGKVVIVSHGSYRTVYGNLAEVSVVKGQKIKTKQEIGTLLPGDGNVSEAHFEIWKITEEDMLKQNPLSWLYKN